MDGQYGSARSWWLDRLEWKELAVVIAMVGDGTTTISIIRSAENTSLRLVDIAGVLPRGATGRRAGEHRVSTIWSATLYTVAGAAIGVVLPSISDRVAYGPRNRARRSTAAGRVRMVLASAVTSTLVGLFGWVHRDASVVASCWMVITGVCLALVDIDCLRLPRLLVGAMATGGLSVFIVMAVVDDRLGSLLTAMLAAGVTAVGMIALAIADPEGVGMGDVTLLPVLALFLGWHGWPVVVAGLFLGWFLTCLVVVGAMAVRRARRGTRVAAGPTLILGSVIAISVHIGIGGAA